MSIPKEPRQMMINMMYLVLTALLALNVSAEILHAFHVVNRGIDNSIAATDSKNSQTLTAFQQQNADDPKRVGPLLAKATQAKLSSDKLYNYIDSLKKVLIDKSGGLLDKNKKKVDLKSGNLASLMKDGELSDDRNLEVSTNMMITNGEGPRLQKKINDLREQLLNLLEPSQKEMMASQLTLIAEDPKETSDGATKNWTETNFEMVPTIAVLTLLNKYQNDIKNSEATVLDNLYSSINSKIIKVDMMQAKVVAPSSYIMAGQEYKADIFVAAYSSTVNPQILVGPLNPAIAKKDATGNYPAELTQNPVVGGGKIIPVENGMGKYSTVAGGEGDQTYTGAVVVNGPDGTPRYYPFEASYTSAKGSAIVSSDNLNIIYAGIPNPFSVSVAGFASNKVTASASSGSFSGSNGKYIASMPSSLINQKVRINVNVTTEGGSKPIGASEFVVKRIPDPVASINGTITEGPVKTGTLRAVQGVGAVLKDFYFQGVVFNVVSFECVYIPKRQDAKIIANQGWRFNSQLSALIAASKPGDALIFRKVRASGPDGTVRSLNSIPLEVQ